MARVSQNNQQQLPEGTALPSDFDAEQATLGSMLLEPGAARRAFAIVGVDDFYWEDHQAICRAMVACGHRNEPVDLVTVSAELRRLKQLGQVGGGAYLTGLISTVPTAAHVVRYANIVAEKAVLRRLIQFGSHCQMRAHENPEGVGKLLEDLQDEYRRVILSRIRTGLALESWASHADNLMATALKAGQGRQPLSAARFGIKTIDDVIGPLADEQMMLLKGPTGGCKSHFCLHTLCSTVDELQRRGEEGRVFVVSFESRGLYERRAMAWWSGINNELIRRGFDGNADPDTWFRLQDVAEAMGDPGRFGHRVYICEHTSDQAEIEKMFRDEYSKGRVVLAIIDYWQAMRRRAGRREIEEYSAATQAFRVLSEDYHIPMLIPAQVTSRSDGAVTSKASTDIQDAATLIMRLTPKQELVCEKHREGPQFSKVPLHVDMQTSRVCTEAEWQARQQPAASRDESTREGTSDPFEQPGNR